MHSSFTIRAAERGIIPDSLVRFGIRRILKQRLNSLEAPQGEVNADRVHNFMKLMDESPIAADTDKANDQHYELPAEFFVQTLGSRLKYSCGYWGAEDTTLDESEISALEQTFTRADLVDGKSVLELGCGWGSLTLFMAERLPNSKIVAVSNSHSQAEFIRQRAAERGISNVKVITCDMNEFVSDQRFDRIVSVEMFEHIRNWRALLHKVAGWLNDGGLMFMHIFVHAGAPYFYQDESQTDWMARYFFSGGLMPSKDLPFAFDQDLLVERSWEWEGTHYEKTANAWLQKMDANRSVLFPAFVETYGKSQAKVWWQRWRMFYMACAELFGYHNGRQWLVGHYRLQKR